MDTFYLHNISNMLVLIGLCVMVSSIFISLTIHKAVSPAIRQKWVIISSMMISFSVGYTIFLFLQFRNIDEYLELITGLVFLGGAVFVFLVMRLIQNTLVLRGLAVVG